MKKMILMSLLIISTSYIRPMEVLETHDDIVTCVSPDGNVWEFYGDCYRQDETVIAIMDTCGTDTITDDLVIWVF